MADISKEHTGELQTKLTVDTQAVSECFPNIIRNMVGGAASALIATIAIFFLNWKMALILLILTPLLMLVMGIVMPFIQKASTADKENEENNRSVMQENLSRIMLIKTYFLQKKVVAKTGDVYARKLRSGMKLGFWEGLATFSGLLVGMSMFLIAMGFGAYFVLQGETTFGNLVAIVQLLNYIVGPVAKFAETISQVSQASASAARIGSIIDLPASTEIPVISSVNATGLVAKNVSFTYAAEDESTDAVLENVNASFEKGIVTGLVGKSGSGKSTLLKLLIGLYEPNHGNISLNHDSGVLTGEQIMTQVAYVPPSDYLFSGTVMDNIIMSEDEPRFEEVEKAANDANILDFIQSLPDGFDTLIGEGGGTVSSGQAQRIAIARAIYKKSPVIVFDEPTANLDGDSIEKFQSTVRQLSKNKICIVVTHDTSTMMACDKVFILEQGSLREKQADEEFIFNGFSPKTT